MTRARNAWPDPLPIVYRLCTRCGHDIRPTPKRRLCRDCYDVEVKAA